MLRAAYLYDDRLATASPLRMLRRIFGAASVDKISGPTLTSDSLKEYQMVFLPGIQGEKSICDELLPEEQRSILYDEVEKRHLTLWAECCWANRLCHTTQYTFKTGIEEKWEGYHWIDAHSEGPALGHLSTDPNDRFREVQLADIVHYSPQGNIDLKICCANGPGLLVNENNLDINIIADYKGLKKDYAAAISQKIGNGLIIASGVLPPITYTHAIGNYTIPEQEMHRAYLESGLRQYHDDIVHLQDQLISHARPYMEQRRANIT